MPPVFDPKATFKRVSNPVVSCKLETDLLERFHALCNATGLTPNKLANQCIRFALDNLKK